MGRGARCAGGEIGRTGARDRQAGAIITPTYPTGANTKTPSGGRVVSMEWATSPAARRAAAARLGTRAPGPPDGDTDIWTNVELNSFPLP